MHTKGPIQEKNHLVATFATISLIAVKHEIFILCLIQEKSHFRAVFVKRNFVNAPHVRTHMKSAHPTTNKEEFSCKICQKKFPSKEYLGTHKALHSSERPFQCDVCSKSFKLSQHLRVHMKSHSKIRTELFCNICSKDFDSAVIKKHKEEVHYDIRAHKCGTCGKRFNRFSEMKRHMDRVHTLFDSKL